MRHADRLSACVRRSARFVGRVVARTTEISGYDRALALAAQAFVALVPLLLIVAAAAPDAARQAVATWLFENPDPGGDAAAVLDPLLQPPPVDTEQVTLLGTALLVVSVTGFTRTLQRTFVVAWELPRPGLFGVGWGLLGAAVLVAGVVLLVLVAPLMQALPNPPLLTAGVRLAPSVGLWWVVQWLLLGGAVGWRPLLPGAAVTGLGQVVVMAVSGLYLPQVIGREAERFGAIGAAFVVVSWLVVLGMLLVVAAVAGAELMRGRTPPAPR
ncbi:YhjD/YihY/BrkB family envelope integrity protein [Pseudonocardia sichuanensis]